MSLRKKIFWWIGIFVIGGAVGYFLCVYVYVRTLKNTTAPVEVRENLSQYEFINPLLLVTTSKDLYVDEYKDLVKSLDAYIDSVKSSDSTVKDVSIYLRDMNTGHWTGIGENDLYHPSSMLKVLTLTSTAQLAENSSLSLTDTLPYAPGDRSLQYYPPENNMATGTYTVQQLVDSAIIDSDNAANSALLSDNAINDEFTALYKIFRLPTATSSTEDFMSPRSYSTIWRALYNATLLSDSTSNEVIQLLTHTTFQDGLVAGVPGSVTAAHKFGEFTNETSSGTILNRELHDCGIVYYPGHPYLLCVMTRGTLFPNLANTIAGVSRLVYDFEASSTTTNI